MIRRLAAAAVGAALTPSAAFGGEKPEAEALWEAMARCAGLEDASSRHACADAALISAGILTTAELSVQRKQEFGLEEPEKKAKAAAPDEAPAITAAEIVEDPDEISVVLAQVDLSRTKRVTVTTAEGAVWKQVGGDAIRPAPEPGQTMVIKKAALGGFKCKIGKWSIFRCKRQF
ncbi:hypothetical protein [Hyphococcus luteus]|nr:hypothetical protein [Marinicaulis flavus]